MDLRALGGPVLEKHSGSDPGSEQCRLSKIIRKPGTERRHSQEQDVQRDHFHRVMLEESAIFRGHLGLPFINIRALKKMLTDLQARYHDDYERRPLQPSGRRTVAGT
jgi:hypothetical protein